MLQKWLELNMIKIIIIVKMKTKVIDRFSLLMSNEILYIFNSKIHNSLIIRQFIN